MPILGPGQRDYCNRMPYAPDRRTALYAGGNHGGPHRINDVWEYHLGSNTWHVLFEADGGNVGRHKPALFLITRTLRKKPDLKITEKQQKQIEAFKTWWLANVVLKDGHFTTKRGGPIMPSHTWDALTYDVRAKRMIWGMGANAGDSPLCHSRFTGMALEKVRAQLDTTYPRMWLFDPAERKWIHYRTDKPRAKLRGMGATMLHIPDFGKSIWYVAAQNVTPYAFEMWTYDAVADTWEELKPNGGKSISTLALKDKVAPMSEQQTAYSPKHKKMVAVRVYDTFAYDVVKNEWSKVTTDERVFGHDAKSVFAYDPVGDAFLLAFPPGGRGKQLSLAALSLGTGKWDIITPKGPKIPATRYGSYMGYYDPVHNVFVIQGRNNRQMWVYRHKKSAG